MEIDLLRGGRHVLAVPKKIARENGDYDYLISVNRARRPRDVFELYLCPLRQPLPKIKVPLTSNAADVTLDLQAVFEETYLKGDYFDRIDYSMKCAPALRRDDAVWARQLIRKTKSRKSKQ